MSQPHDHVVVDAPTETFESFVRVIAPELLLYFLRRVSPPDGAADCVSEVLLVLWRRHDDFPGSVDQRRAWAFGIAHHVLANHYRGRVRKLALAERLRQELLTTTRPTDAEHDSHKLGSALAQLPLSDRELLLLVAWEGLSLIDAAQALGIRPDAARARYSRLRTKLRRSLT